MVISKLQTPKTRKHVKLPKTHKDEEKRKSDDEEKSHDGSLADLQDLQDSDPLKNLIIRDVK